MRLDSVQNKKFDKNHKRYLFCKEKHLKLVKNVHCSVNCFLAYFVFLMFWIKNIVEICQKAYEPMVESKQRGEQDEEKKTS